MPKKKADNSVIVPYRLMASFALITCVSIGLLAIRILSSHSYRYGFLAWNLLLAVLPGLLAWWLVARLRRWSWLGWRQLLLTFSWVVFLPNSFYIITDLVHLRPNYEAELLFDISLLTSFIASGLIYGYASVYLVHKELRKRLGERYAYVLIAALFLAVSFAICLGRYTRWNTWDIILRPAGLLYDVSDRFINPNMHAETYKMTAVLFLVLFSSYCVIYEMVRLMRRP